MELAGLTRDYQRKRFTPQIVYTNSHSFQTVHLTNTDHTFLTRRSHGPPITTNKLGNSLIMVGQQTCNAIYT